MNVYSWKAVLIFLAQDLQTRSDRSGELLMCRPICEDSSAKVSSSLHSSRFDGLNKFSVEIYKAFWKSPNCNLSLHEHNLQQSFAALLIGRPRFTGFFGVSPLAMHTPSVKRSICLPCMLFSRLFESLARKQIIDTCRFHGTTSL